MAKEVVNPFQELIHVLKHNGSTNSRLSEISGPRFFNLLKKAGWDQAFSGKGQTHILMRLREPARGGACNIFTLRDFASALEHGFPHKPDKWVSLGHRAVFVVNWKKRGFVTLLVLGDQMLQEIKNQG